MSTIVLHWCNALNIARGLFQFQNASRSAAADFSCVPRIRSHGPSRSFTLLGLAALRRSQPANSLDDAIVELVLLAGNKQPPPRRQTRSRPPFLLSATALPECQIVDLQSNPAAAQASPIGGAHQAPADGGPGRFDLRGRRTRAGCRDHPACFGFGFHAHRETPIPTRSVEPESHRKPGKRSAVIHVVA